MIKSLKINTMDCLWIDYHLENVDNYTSVIVRDICNNSTFYSEFGGHFVFKFQTLSRAVKNCYPP